MPSDDWDWLNAAEVADADDVEICRSFARAFAGSDGARVLAWLRATTIERRLSPEATEAALRHLEGQRHLAAAIERMVVRGRESSGVWLTQPVVPDLIRDPCLRVGRGA